MTAHATNPRVPKPASRTDGPPEVENGNHQLILGNLSWECIAKETNRTSAIIRKKREKRGEKCVEIMFWHMHALLKAWYLAKSLELRFLW